jgi:hypothetical protein
MPGTAHTVRIEAASYRGRPVAFEIVGPWTKSARDVTDEAAPVGNGPGR